MAHAGSQHPTGTQAAAAVSLVDAAILGEFLARQEAVLQAAERRILALRDDDGTALEAVRRFYHTLKGEAGLLELESVAAACHAAEDLLQQERPVDCVEPLLATLTEFRSAFERLRGEVAAPADGAVRADRTRVPVRPVFRKMAHLVQELSRKLGRPVALVTAGEDLVLEQELVEGLDEPLVQLLRNAMDHGLEPDAAARRRAGKPPVGRIELRAGRRGGDLLIEVLDDGRGLDPQAILARARERGLVGADATPGEQELFQLIFRPGFSTAPALTEISGRGIGMDIVRDRVAALQGTVMIESTPGRGTRFGLCLPQRRAPRAEPTDGGKGA